MAQSTEMSKKNGPSVEAQLKAARQQERAGDAAGARALYAEVLSRFPANARARKALEALDAAESATAERDPLLWMMKLIEAGRYSEALEKAHRLLASGGDAARVQDALAVIHMRRGDAEAAVSAAREAVALAPGRAGYHFNLGCALLDAHEADAAADAFEAALARDTAHGQAAYNLGRAHQMAGEGAAALRAYHRAMRLLPGYAQGYLTLGNAEREAGHAELAEAAYRQAVALSPDMPEAHVNLGSILHATGQEAAAADEYRAALALNPGDGHARHDLALTLANMGQGAAALEEARRAAQALPDDPGPRLTLGNLLREFGDTGGAAEAFRDALRVFPNTAEAYENLVAVHRFTAGDPLVTEIAAKLSIPGLSGASRMSLHYAMAKAADDMDDPEGTVAHLTQANALRKAGMGYDIAQDEALFAALRSGFAVAPPALDVAPGPVMPVFILGLPRSGTTLVERVLAAHPAVTPGGERPALERLVRRHLPDLLTDGTPPEADALRRVREEYLADLGSVAPLGVVTDKMPLNLRFLGVILSALPEARILLTERDPRAVCWSCLRTGFTRGNGFANDQRDVALYFRLCSSLISQVEDTWPGRIGRVDYDALTADPEPEIRKLVAAAGLPWDDACLDHRGAADGARIATASALQARQPIYAGSSDAWRRYAPWLTDMLEALKSG